MASSRPAITATFDFLVGEYACSFLEGTRVDETVNPAILDAHRIVGRNLVEAFSADLRQETGEQVGHVFEIPAPVRAEQDPLSRRGFFYRGFESLFPIGELIVSVAVEKVDHHVLVALGKNVLQRCRLRPRPVGRMLMRQDKAGHDSPPPEVDLPGLLTGQSQYVSCGTDGENFVVADRHCLGYGSRAG